MEILISILIMVFFVGIISFVGGTVYVVSKSKYKTTVNFFRKYLVVVFTGLIVLYVLMLIISALNMEVHEYLFVVFIKLLIQLIYFVAIYLYTHKLMKNLSSEIIFDDANAHLTKQIGLSFLYLTITEILAGLIIGIIHFINTNRSHFGLSTNAFMILFVSIGFILLIVSFILEKAIEIYKENSLTI